MRLGVGHLSAIKPRTSSSFESMSSAAGAPRTDDGLTIAGARYDFAKETYLSAVNQIGWNTFNTFYAEGAYFRQITDPMSVEVGAQFTEQRSFGQQLAGNFEVQSGGAITSFGYRSLIASVSGTWTSNTSGLQKPWGGSPSYNSVLIADFDRAGETSMRVGFSYDFTDIGLDGVWLRVRYGNLDAAGSGAGPTVEDFRVILNYSVQF